MIGVAENKDYEGFSFNINVNPVFSTHWKFLTSDSFKGTSRQRTRREIKNQLSKSVRYLHHALNHTKKLVLEKDDKTNKWKELRNARKDLYDVFNAQTIEPILKNLVRDFKNDKLSMSEGYKYDFRTSENARVMLEMALDYLIHSPEFKNRNSTNGNAKQISEDFKLLSRSTLSKERELLELKLSSEIKEKKAKQIGLLTKEFLKTLDKLYDTIMPISSLTNLPNSIEVKDIRKALEETREKIILELMRAKIELDNKKLTIKNKKPQTILSNELEKIEKGLSLIESLQEIENKIIKNEKELYSEIENYFSPINPITDFTITEEIKEKVKEIID